MQRSSSFDTRLTVFFFLLYFIVYNLLYRILPIEGIMLLNLILFFGIPLWLAGHIAQPHEQLNFPLNRKASPKVPHSVKIE